MDASGWAEQEFGACELGDPRRTRRLVKIVGDQAAQPSGSYSQAAGGNRYDLKGYYRFLNSEREDLNVESLLQTHRRQTIRRMKHESTVLIVQDTSIECAMVRLDLRACGEATHASTTWCASYAFSTLPSQSVDSLCAASTFWGKRRLSSPAAPARQRASTQAARVPTGLAENARPGASGAFPGD